MQSHMILGQAIVRQQRPDLKAHANFSCRLARLQKTLVALLGFKS